MKIQLLAAITIITMCFACNSCTAQSPNANTNAENSLTRKPIIGSLPIIDINSAHQIAASVEASKTGDAFAKLQDWQQASKAYQQSIMAWDGNQAAYYGLAKCAAAMGDVPSEINNYRVAIYARTPFEYGKVPGDGFRENHLDKLMEFVLLLSQAGQEQEALSVYQHSMSLLLNEHGKPNLPIMLPDFRPGSWRYTAQHLQAMAYVALAANPYGEANSEALTQLRQAVNIAPDAAVAYFYLGETLKYKIGHEHEAVAAFSQAAQLGGVEMRTFVDKAIKEGSAEFTAAVKKSAMSAQ